MTFTGLKLEQNPCLRQSITCALKARLSPLSPHSAIIMDIFALTLPATASINPPRQAILRRMTGTKQAADYSTTPLYEEHHVTIEIQPIPSGVLHLLDNIAQQSESRIIYIQGTAHTLSRPLHTGGDSLLYEGSEWLVTKVLEQWGAQEWCRLIVTRQITPPQTSN